MWDSIDCLVTPTASTAYTIAAVEADPIRLNSNLGHYTNFVNLLDLSAVAVPTGFMTEAMANMPWGVTLVAPAGQDLPLLSLAARLHARTVPTVGATPHAPHLLASATPDAAAFPSGLVRVAVCGAHLSGLPLNWATDPARRQAGAVPPTARLATSCLPCPAGHPIGPACCGWPKAVPPLNWRCGNCRAREFGSFVAGIPAPLGIGTVELADGSQVQGFVCEALCHMHGKRHQPSGWLAGLSAQHRPIGH